MRASSRPSARPGAGAAGAAAGATVARRTAGAVAAGVCAAAAGLVAAAGPARSAYVHDMRRAYTRLRGRSAVVRSPFGEIEYAEGGSGPDVLVVHGSGGGFDQGELLAEAVVGDGVRWIAPSRFGYLGSAVPDGASFADQADAYAWLLDRLEVGRAAVVALSHGGPSALLFAARHPERVSSLTLISCGVASSTAAEQAAADRRGDLLTTVFGRDALYWLVTRVARRPLMRLLGANDGIVADLTAEQRGLLDRVIDSMNPVAPRAAGVAFDNTAALPDEGVGAVKAPTLVLHAEDDTLQLFHNAEFAAAHVPGARLVRFAHGGHLVMIVEQQAIRALVRGHIRAATAAPAEAAACGSA